MSFCSVFSGRPWAALRAPRKADSLPGLETADPAGRLGVSGGGKRPRCPGWPRRFEGPKSRPGSAGPGHGCWAGFGRPSACERRRSAAEPEADREHEGASARATRRAARRGEFPAQRSVSDSGSEWGQGDCRIGGRVSSGSPPHASAPPLPFRHGLRRALASRLLNAVAGHLIEIYVLSI